MPEVGISGGVFGERGDDSTADVKWDGGSHELVIFGNEFWQLCEEILKFSTARCVGKLLENIKLENNVKAGAFYFLVLLQF